MTQSHGGGGVDDDDDAGLWGQACERAALEAGLSQERARAESLQAALAQSERGGGGGTRTTASQPARVWKGVGGGMMVDAA